MGSYNWIRIQKISNKDQESLLYDWNIQNISYVSTATIGHPRAAEVTVRRLRYETIEP